MKILFWGAHTGCGTTSSMAAVASHCAMRFSHRSFVLQHKNGNGDLESFFQPPKQQRMLREESSYYMLEGMDYLIWQEQHRRLDWISMKESMISVIDNRLFYLPGGSREKPGLYPAQTSYLQQRVIDRMEEFADLIFIDIGSGNDVFAKELLETADLIIVTLPQKKEVLDGFFKEHKPNRTGRILYLMGNYDSNEVYNRSNISRIYRIAENDSYVVPANPFFAQACAAGKMEQFMKKNFRSSRSYSTEQFMRELTRLTTVIEEAYRAL